MDASNRPIRVDPARSGRPSSGDRTYRPDELVRVEIRMPAKIAAEIYALARETRQPVSRTACDLLTHALADSRASAMG